MDRPQPVARGDPAPRRKQGGRRPVRIGTVLPAHEVEESAGRRRGREGTLELGDDECGIRLRTQDEERRSLQRRCVVPGQVHHVWRRGHDDGTETPRRGLGRDAIHAIRVPVAHNFTRICWGTTWNVAGVVPIISPSATIGSGRSASTATRTFACSSVMSGSGTWSPCRNILGSIVYAFDRAPWKTSASMTPSPGNERGDRRTPPAVNCPFATTTLNAGPS